MTNQITKDKPKSKLIYYILLIIILFILIFKVNIFGITVRSDGARSTKNQINVQNEDESLASVQGKWSVTLDGYYNDEEVNIRLLIDGHRVELYSKKESEQTWNMDSPDEVSKLRLMPYMSDHAYSQIYHRLVDFEGVKEKNDVLGKLSLTKKIGSMKIFNDRVEMSSMIGLSDFSKGW